MFMVVLSQRPPHTIFSLTLIVIGGADLWLGIRMFQSSPLHLLLAVVFCFLAIV